MSRNHFKDSSLFNRIHVRSWICGILISALIPVNIFATGIGVDVQDVNADFNFSALDVTNYNNTLNLVFGSKDTDEKYMAITAIYRGLARAFGPAYTYQITSNTAGTPASYFETENLNRQLQTVTQNQWYINNNISGIRNYMDPISQVVSDIKTNTTNTAASTNAALTLLGDQVNINWTDVSQFQGVSLTYGGAFVDRSSNYPNWNVSDLYWYFDNFNVAGQNFFRVQIPTRAAAQNNLNNYVDYIEVIGSNGQPIQADYTLEYDYMSNRLLIYFLNYIPFVQGYPYIIHIHYSANISYFVSQDHKISYLPYDTTDYIMKSNNLYLRELLKKDSNIEVNIDDSINSTNIELDVSIGINDFQEVNTISNKLRTWLSTGVGVSALIAALDQLDDSFFTLHNRSVIETINNQYTDFYD